MVSNCKSFNRRRAKFTIIDVGSFCRVTHDYAEELARIRWDMIQKRKYESDRGLSYDVGRGLIFTVDVYQDMQLKGCGIRLIRNAAYQGIALTMYIPFIGQTAFFIESKTQAKHNHVAKQLSLVLHGDKLILSINNNNYILKKGKD